MKNVKTQTGPTLRAQGAGPETETETEIEIEKEKTKEAGFTALD